MASFFKKDKLFRQLLQYRYFGNMADIAVHVFDVGRCGAVHGKCRGGESRGERRV